MEDLNNKLDFISFEKSAEMSDIFQLRDMESFSRTKFHENVRD